MKFTLRHIILLVGLAIIILSFLFFGRDTRTYDLLMLTGLLISVIAFLTILFKKDTVKSKIICTILVFVFVGLQQLTEPILIKTSYGIFIKKYNPVLTKLNKIVGEKTNDVFFIPSLDTVASKDFGPTEIHDMQTLLTGTGISLIKKDNQKIFYRTFGMLDVSHGIYYFYSNDKPDERYKYISGCWYD